jgi:hypothetical protein
MARAFAKGARAVLLHAPILFLLVINALFAWSTGEVLYRCRTSLLATRDAPKNTANALLPQGIRVCSSLD